MFVYIQIIMCIYNRVVSLLNQLSRSRHLLAATAAARASHKQTKTQGREKLLLRKTSAFQAALWVSLPPLRFGLCLWHRAKDRRSVGKYKVALEGTGQPQDLKSLSQLDS
jgi:hypothetical protein